MNADEWEALFGSGGTQRRFHILRKHGKPFLILPRAPRLAARTLELYPAQTHLARLARATLRVALRCGLPSPHGAADLSWNPEAPLQKWIHAQFGAHTEIGILLGNPNAAGRRWILLIFDAAQNPIAVVKAGVSPRARELIFAEAQCISNLPATFRGKPTLLSQMEGDVAALALAYVPGTTPSPDASPAQLGSILTSWVRPAETVAFSEIPAWQRVINSTGLPDRLANVKVAATTMHGDFVPWNIREHDGQWTVLDWERGEALGVPGWDWLHFLIQSEVLVRKSSGEQAFSKVQALFQTVEWGHYARLCGIESLTAPLLVAYVIYSLEVLRQTEGTATMRSLLQCATTSMKGG